MLPCSRARRARRSCRAAIPWSDTGWRMTTRRSANRPRILRRIADKDLHKTTVRIRTTQQDWDCRMVDTKSPGDKTLSVPTKTLTLKPRVETGTVRQSFSHGRTKQVVVEKRGKRRVGGDAPAAESHAPEPVVAKAAPAKAPLARPAAPPRSNSGVVLR